MSMIPTFYKHSSGQSICRQLQDERLGMAEQLQQAVRDQGNVAADVEGDQSESADVDPNQTSVLSDAKSFVDSISSFYNQQALSDVTVQVTVVVVLSWSWHPLHRLQHILCQMGQCVVILACEAVPSYCFSTG